MDNLTNAQLFDQLNKFRVRAGKAPLKVLKISRAQLIDQLNKFAPQEAPVAKAPDMPSIDNRGPRPSDNLETTGQVDPEKTKAQRAARIENDRKNAALQRLEAEKPSPEKKRNPVARKAKSGEPSAAEIAGEFGIQPKVARALLRKHGIERTAAAMRAFFKSRTK